jgi:carbon storage regulator
VLILSRKLNESIVIDGRIVVTVMRVQGEVVKLGIEAAADVPIHRQEIYEEIQASNLEALASGRARSATVPRLVTSKPEPSTFNSNPTRFP